MSHRWSHYQEAIYEAFENTSDSLLIEAVAGSGKTTVLVELARIMRERFPQQRGCFMAFNKSIATTLQERIGLGGNVVAMTLHSAGWAAWRRAGGLDWQPGLDQHKVSGIIRKLMTWEERKRWEETTRKLVGFAKGIGLLPDWTTDANGKGELGHWRDYRGLVEDTQETWDALIEHYGLLPDECNIELARKVLAASIELATESCDYDDMLYMPVVAGVPFDRYDVVLVDEAQDVSGIQMEMISRMVEFMGSKPIDPNDHGTVFDGGYMSPVMQVLPGRVIAVGDRSQAIYGFRGAGTDSMDQLRERFGMRELPLSVSYRCPRSVVEHARQWVPQIEWREDAPVGVVLGEETDYSKCLHCGGTGTLLNIASAPVQWCDCKERSKWTGLPDFLPEDAILCRLNRPLIAAAFALIRARIACRVLGREIGAGLVSLVKKPKFDAGRPVSDWEAWAGEWFERERVKLAEKRQFAQIGNLEDRLATVGVFIDELEDRGEGWVPTIGDLIQSIEAVFRDRGPEGMVTLGTVHKFKGLEAGRVFILDAGELMPVPWGRGGGWELAQERNMQYVAATRAQRELRYITSASLGIERRKR